MRGWTSFFCGFLLLGLAYWSFSADGFGSSMLMFAAGAAFFIYRGANGQEVDAAGDPTAVMEFVSDPADAIVDTATDKIADWLGESKSAAADWLREPKSAPADSGGFDPDAVIARYLENRGEDRGAEAVSQPASAAPVRGFGRKGL